MERLSGGLRQAIAVARAINSPARILPLNEPLAVMGAREAGQVTEPILHLKVKAALSIAMIMHNGTSHGSHRIARCPAARRDRQCRWPSGQRQKVQ